MFERTTTFDYKDIGEVLVGLLHLLANTLRVYRVLYIANYYIIILVQPTVERIPAKSLKQLLLAQIKGLFLN